MTIYWFIVLPVESPIAGVPYERKKCAETPTKFMIKMNQATHLPISIVSQTKSYENDNIFLEKY